MSLKESNRKVHHSLGIDFKYSCEEYYDAIYKYCYIKLGSEQEALDCTQETFERFYERIQTDVDIKKPKAYIYKIAKFVCAKRIKQISQLKRKYADLYYIIDSLSVEEQLELEQFEDRIDEVAKEIIGSLKPDELKLYNEYYIKSIPVKEIANNYGVSTSWVNKRVAALRQTIKRKVRKYLMGGSYLD